MAEDCVIQRAKELAYIVVELECEFLGALDDAILCQVICSVENKGKVIYRISEGFFSIYPIFQDHPVAASLRLRGDIWLGERFSKCWFVFDHISLQYPQTKTVFSQMIWLPRHAKFVRFYSKIRSPGPGVQEFNLERAFAVPKLDDVSTGG